jgi:hypothetical protein
VRNASTMRAAFSPASAFSELVVAPTARFYLAGRPARTAGRLSEK